MNRKRPSWIKTTAYPIDNTQVKKVIGELKLSTICWEGACPNRYECWNRREAAFLIGGNICTRRCSFCNVKTGKPTNYDVYEPNRLASSIKKLNLKYATVTGVERDDLPDRGAWLYAESVRAIRQLCEQTKIELLIPDFKGEKRLIEYVIASKPDVLGHNLETVERIFRKIRPGFNYNSSLSLLRYASNKVVTKSNIMLGLGERREEVKKLVDDIYATGCRLLTITQYLPPTKQHQPVDRWVTPDEFKTWREYAYECGYWAVYSGPLVRSSYRANEMYSIALDKIA